MKLAIRMVGDLATRRPAAESLRRARASDGNGRLIGDENGMAFMEMPRPNPLSPANAPLFLLVRQRRSRSREARVREPMRLRTGAGIREYGLFHITPGKERAGLFDRKSGEREICD